MPRINDLLLIFDFHTFFCALQTRETFGLYVSDPSYTKAPLSGSPPSPAQPEIQPVLEHPTYAMLKPCKPDPMQQQDLPFADGDVKMPVIMPVEEAKASV